MILKDTASGHPLYLRSLHVFGRNANKSDTILDNQDASQLHASLRWNGLDWELTDHSRNGTFLNGKRINANEPVVLSVGQQIRFAPGSLQTWVVEDLSAPVPILLPIGSDAPCITLTSPHFLPDELNPQASLHRCAHGSWSWQSANDSVVLRDGDIVTLAHNGWRFFSGQTEDATADIGGQHLGCGAKTNFSFKVSENEEHVVLTVSTEGKQADLGERTHHYSLLTLARRRFNDALRGLDASAQGWLGIDQLSTMLGLEPAHLNMHLFRARVQISRHFPGRDDLHDVLERRRGEVRVAAMPFEIIRGSRLEARFDPFSSTSVYPVPGTTSSTNSLCSI